MYIFALNNRSQSKNFHLIWCAPVITHSESSVIEPVTISSGGPMCILD